MNKRLVVGIAIIVLLLVVFFRKKIAFFNSPSPIPVIEKKSAMLDKLKGTRDDRQLSI
jgi:hypothetical protein